MCAVLFRFQTNPDVVILQAYRQAVDLARSNLLPMTTLAAVATLLHRHAESMAELAVTPLGPANMAGPAAGLAGSLATIATPRTEPTSRLVKVSGRSDQLIGRPEHKL